MKEKILDLLNELVILSAFNASPIKIDDDLGFWFDDLEYEMVIMQGGPFAEFTVYFREDREDIRVAFDLNSHGIERWFDTSILKPYEGDYAWSSAIPNTAWFHHDLEFSNPEEMKQVFYKFLHDVELPEEVL